MSRSDHPTPAVFLSLGIAFVGFVSCQTEDSKGWNNPADPGIANSSLPSLRVASDTLFEDSSEVEMRVVATSQHGPIVRLRWQVADVGAEIEFASSDSVMTLSVPGLGEGEHVVVVKVQDAKASWSEPDTVRLRVWNEPPVLKHVSDTSLGVNAKLEVELRASDPDGTIAGMYWGLANGVWSDSGSRIVLESEVETSRKLFWMVRDDHGKAVSDSFVVTFVNRAPLLARITDTLLPGSGRLSISLEASDPEGAIAMYYFDTVGLGWRSRWDSSTKAPALSIGAASEVETRRTIRWGARDNQGKLALDTFVVVFTNRPLLAPMGWEDRCARSFVEGPGRRDG